MGVDRGIGSRAATKSKTVGGAIITPKITPGVAAVVAGAKAAGLTTPLGSTYPQPIGLGNNILKRPKFQLGPNASQRPSINPGVSASLKGKTWATGNLVPMDFSNPADHSTSLMRSDYGFSFHYNPESIAVTNPTCFQYEPSLMSLGTPLTAALSTIQFQVLINRSEDIIDKRSLGINPILGVRSLDKIGTQYDIEWFFRTVNGLRSTLDPSLATADIGLLIATAMRLQLGPLMTWVGYVTSMTFTHLKFTAAMVPMVTLMDINFGRFTDAQAPTVSAGAPVDSSAAPVAVPAPKPKATPKPSPRAH
jgi:hypothetical protein